MYSLAFLLAAVCAAAADEMVRSVSYGLTRESADSAELVRVADQLISLRENQPLESPAMAQSIDALKACRLFESIDVEMSDGSVHFSLTPARHVRDIRIRGAHPLFADEVEAAMSTYPGDIFREEMLSQQESIITDFYKGEGFVSPRAKVTSSAHRSGDGIVLHVDIDAGVYYRLDGIKISGNNVVSGFGLRRRMKIWRSSLFPGSAGRFLEKDLRSDVAALVELYRSKRFADVQIRDTVIIDSSDNTATVVLDIDEGDRYRIEYSGRKERGFSKRALNSEVTIFSMGNRNNLGLRSSMRAIDKKMRESGYLDAQIDFSDTAVRKRNYTERVVTFDINRGPRTTVSSIRIDGSSRVGTDQIRAQMLHTDRGSASRRTFNPEVLQEDVVAIRMLYLSRGFLNAQVSSSVNIADHSAAIIIEVDEGAQTRIDDVSVDMDRFPDIDADKVIKAKSGDIFSSSLLNQNARNLQEIIAEKGYPHVEVTPVTRMNSDSSRADVEFRIDEGPLVHMGDVRYIGAFRTQERVLDRALKASPGEPLSLRDIAETQNRIRDMGPFASSRFRIIGLREKRDTVQVFIEVTEAESYYGILSAGYQSDEGPFLDVKIGDRNIMGLNKNGWVSAEVSQIGYRGEVNFVDPRLLGTSLRALIGIYGESISELNLDWGRTAYGISSAISSSIGRHAVLGVGTSYERRRFEGTPPDSLVPFYDEDSWRDIVVVSPTFSYDRRDNFTRPRSGVFLEATVEVSNGIANALDDFAKVQAEFRGYFSPQSRLTIAGVARGGYILSYGGESEISIDQLFYLGGTQNIRGFSRNLFNPDSSGGTATISASIEARIDIGLNIELALFSDAGRLEDDFDTFSAGQFRSSAGAGIRYITPIGPVGLLYGHKLNRREGEGAGAFHFSLGYTF